MKTSQTLLLCSRMAILSGAFAVSACTGSGVDALSSATAPQPLPSPPVQQALVPTPSPTFVAPVQQQPAIVNGQPANVRPAAVPAAIAAQATPQTSSAYPNLGRLPTAAVEQMTPQEEAAMLTRLNEQLGNRPTLSAAEKAAFEKRRLRLLQLARTNEASVQSAIEAR